jgi:hypothetical protein
MKKENRGGKREGAGRPKKEKNYSEDFKEKVFEALEEKAKETGRTIYQVMVDLVYDDNTQSSVKQGMIKLIKEIFVISESKRTVEEIKGPTIYVPVQMEKPEEIKDMEEQFKKDMENMKAGNA